VRLRPQFKSLEGKNSKKETFIDEGHTKPCAKRLMATKHNLFPCTRLCQETSKLKLNVVHRKDLFG